MAPKLSEVTIVPKTGQVFTFFILVRYRSVADMFNIPILDVLPLNFDPMMSLAIMVHSKFNLTSGKATLKENFAREKAQNKHDSLYLYFPIKPVPLMRCEDMETLCNNLFEWEVKVTPSE